MERVETRYKDKLATFAEQHKNNRRLWNVGTETIEALCGLIKIKEPKRILEIGTSNGYSAFWMSVAAAEFEGCIDTIECHKERYEMAEANLKDLANINLHFGKAEDIIPSLAAEYDFVFIDANKEGYEHYLELLEPLLLPKAVVIADNVKSHYQSVKNYLLNVKTNPKYASFTIAVGSGLELSIYQGKE
jgi:predicted O-methyltransferase YrrM